MEIERLKYRIALNLVPGVGDVLIRNLVSYCGSEKAVFKSSLGKLKMVPGIGEFIAKQIKEFKNFERAEQEVEFIQKHSIEPLYYNEKGYPPLLTYCEDAPNLLFSLGSHKITDDFTVAIVGTRNASEYGKRTTKEIVEVLAPFDVAIVSGLALGIDGVAHKHALDCGMKTIGVLAHGLDRVYPSQHRQLAGRIVKEGALYSEFFKGTQPDRENFPRRNRIVAGMCHAVIVVETAFKGGARITAEIANSYNREVYCLPGRVNDYYSQGCNFLVQTHKANLLGDIEELPALLGIELMEKSQKVKKAELKNFSLLNEDDKKLLTYLKTKERAPLDEMAFDLQVDPSTLALKLLELEFSGFLRSLPGKVFEPA